MTMREEQMNSGGLYGLLAEQAKHCAHAPAAVDVSFGLRSSFHELKERVDALAVSWQKYGVDSGSRVLWLGQNSARVLECLLACARLGAVFCPVNWRQSEAELEFVVNDVDPALVLWQQTEIGDRLSELRARDEGGERAWLQHDGEPGEYEASLVDPRKADIVVPACDINEPVLMLYTAAFGGQPNGALLSHRAIMAQSQVFIDIRKLTNETRYLNVGPLFHVATLLETMATFQVGGCNVFIRRAEAETICEAIEKERCTSTFVLPPVIEQIVEYSKQHPVNLKTMCTLGGGEEWNKLITVDASPWGKRPYGFGQTETFGYASYCVLGEGAKGPMGRASPAVEICMLDEAGNELPVGEVGEIAVRGATVMNGYWRRPELNALRRVGAWHRCNDIGRIEDDGSLSFIGPKQRVIRSAQENIYPAEVENCLKRHPSVAQAAVIGVPDEQWDQSVKAIVVREGTGVCSEADIIAFCKEHIASYKKPKSVEFVASLPMVGAAIDYDELDRSFGGGGYPGLERG